MVSHAMGSTPLSELGEQDCEYLLTVACKAQNLWTGPAALSRALRLMVQVGHLYTLGLNRTQDSFQGPEKVFGGSIRLEAQQLIPKRTRMFCLALKKLNHKYFFKGQTKHSGSFWNQLLSLQ